MKKQNSAFSEFSNVHGLSVPLGMPDLGVAVRPEPGCALGGNDSLVVWLRPYTALSSCPSGQLRDWAGECVHCHDLEVSARHAPGGLPRARAELRVRRVHRGRGASGARRRAQGAEQREHLRVGVRPGVLPCRMGLRQLQHAGAGVSARPALARVQRASGRGLHAVPGPASREGLLSSAANKQWAKGDECASECSAGLYNDKTQFAEGRCRHCWDRTELALHAGLEQQFFALFACNATRNARPAPCAQESGAHLARTVRIRVAAGVLRNQLPAAVAEHARAQQHRRGHLRPPLRS